MWCFLFLLNFAGPQKSPRENLSETITRPLKKREPLLKMKKKWVDDMSILTSLDLKKSVLLDNSIAQEGPVSYHNRTGHVLPKEKNPLIPELKKVKEYADKHKMKINNSKAKVMLFNPHKTMIFNPKFHLRKTLMNWK